MNEPLVNVGILTATEVMIDFHGTYLNGPHRITGKHKFRLNAQSIEWDNGSAAKITFTPESPDAAFELHGVTIGIGFHWERTENQTFQGAVKLIATESGITVINVIDTERYLMSVISSEMRSTSSVELLKAHAVISRSWLLAQIKESGLDIKSENSGTESAMTHSDQEIMRWYDHSDHTLFDICADDHCQRYQGITRISTPTVDEAVNQTRGLVLMHDGLLCDARFSKCCGGVLEQFENCWQPDYHPYLHAKRDIITAEATPMPDLTNEQNARQWIMSEPKSFCNTTDRHVLDQVLNSYDCETPDFYRWTVHYTQDQLRTIIMNRSGIDFGRIIDLIPLSRGTSGRIIRLKITGEKCSITIGKELEIRRWLSRSHLYSSAFVAEMTNPDNQGIPQDITLYGAGWGHGVGLCQIGAAMMAESGYTYDRILSHYYPGSSLEQIY